MLKPDDKVVCVDASGPDMGHLEQGKTYVLEWIRGMELKLVNVPYSVEAWRFVFALRDDK